MCACEHTEMEWNEIYSSGPKKIDENGLCVIDDDDEN